MNRNRDVNPPRTKESTTWRVFCAIAIPDAVRQQIRDHVNSLVRSFPDVKASWTNADNIHLTIKFLGNIAIGRVHSITDSAAAATNELKAFDVEIGSCGVFPGRSRPKVLWIGISDPSGGLSQLQKRLEIECEKRGFPKEDRPFRPHLTIARLRGGNDTRTLVEAHLATKFPVQIVTVNELTVFRSDLSSHGSKYTAISKHTIA